MSKNSYICIGKIKDAHGIRGEFYVFLFSEKADWLEKFTLLHLNSEKREELSEDQLTSFEVDRARPHKKGLIVMTKSVNDRTEAESHKGKFVYIPSLWVTSEKGENYYLNEIKGFEVFNGGESLGPVLDFGNNGAQDLIILEFKGEKRQIPYVEDFIIEVDFDKKCIMMRLPEGLLDL